MISSRVSSFVDMSFILWLTNPRSNFDCQYTSKSKCEWDHQRSILQDTHETQEVGKVVGLKAIGNERVIIKKIKYDLRSAKKDQTTCCNQVASRRTFCSLTMASCKHFPRFRAKLSPHYCLPLCGGGFGLFLCGFRMFLY